MKGYFVLLALLFATPFVLADCCCPEGCIQGSDCDASNYFHGCSDCTCSEDDEICIVCSDEECCGGKAKAVCNDKGCCVSCREYEDDAPEFGLTGIIALVIAIGAGAGYMLKKKKKQEQQ